MKVLFIATSSNASPARGGRRRIVDVAHQSTALGLIPHILCFLPFEQVIRGPKFWRSGKASLQNEAQAPVTYWPMLPLTRYHWLERINIWYCGLITACLCHLQKTRIAYGHGMRAAHIAISAKSFKKPLRTIADFHGASAAEFQYQSKLKPEDKTLQHLENDERFVLTQANHLIFVSKRMHTYYEQKFDLLINNYAVIPCAINALFQIKADLIASMRREHDLENKLVITYAGSAVAYQLVDEMCVLFKAIHQHIPNAHFLILTHDRSKFERHLNNNGINEIDYSIYSVDHNTVFDFLQLGDVGLMLRDNTIVNRVASPTKFAEYLLCGLPVITTDFVGDFSDAVKENNLGLTIDLAELDQVSEVINFLSDVQSCRGDYAQRCNKFVIYHLTWNVFRESIFAVITGKPSFQSSSINSDILA